jgi:hypothetical protein
VSLSGQLPAQLKATLDAKVAVDQAIATSLGAIRINTSELTLERKSPDALATGN